MPAFIIEVKAKFQLGVSENEVVINFYSSPRNPETPWLSVDPNLRTTALAIHRKLTAYSVCVIVLVSVTLLQQRLSAMPLQEEKLCGFWFLGIGLAKEGGIGQSVRLTSCTDVVYKQAALYIKSQNLPTASDELSDP